MRNLFLIICALCFAQTAFGALDRDYFDYTDSPEFQSIPTDTSVQNANYANGTSTSTQPTYTTQRVVRTVTTKGKKRIRFGNEGSSWINTYWNFGQPVYGETGRF